MKIQVTGKGKNIRLSIPNALIFNSLTLRVAGSAARKYAPEAMAKVTPEQMNVLFRELKRIQKKYGSWELVEVYSADGEVVKVIL